MVLVTFRNPKEKLTAMFGRSFRTVEQAKDFITADAEHYATTRGFGEHSKLVNVDPNVLDYFELRKYKGAIRGKGTVELIYQYFVV